MTGQNRINRKDLQTYLKALKENESITLNTDQDVLKQFIVPTTDDSKSYRAKKVYLVDEEGNTLTDDLGKQMVQYVPEEIQLNVRRAITPNLTTGNLTEWELDRTKLSKKTTSDEEYCTKAYQLMNACRFIMARDPRIDINQFVDIIHNEIDFITTISKARGGLLLTASRTNRNINEAIAVPPSPMENKPSAIDAFNGKSRKPNMSYMNNLDNEIFY